jgi:2-aminoadipate transaminase
MRDLMALTAQPQVISLAGGLPDVSAFPAELLAKITAQLAAEVAVPSLQYAPTEGMHDDREAIIEVMAAENIRNLEVDDILVTTGGQQAIDLCCRVLVDPGDVVIAEAPTYPGAVPCFNSFEADLVQIEMDGDGMRVDILEETLTRLKADG